MSNLEVPMRVTQAIANKGKEEPTMFSHLIFKKLNSLLWIRKQVSEKLGHCPE